MLPPLGDAVLARGVMATPRRASNAVRGTSTGRTKGSNERAGAPDASSPSRSDCTPAQSTVPRFGRITIRITSILERADLSRTLLQFLRKVLAMCVRPTIARLALRSCQRRKRRGSSVIWRGYTLTFSNSSHDRACVTTPHFPTERETPAAWARPITEDRVT